MFGYYECDWCGDKEKEEDLISIIDVGTLCNSCYVKYQLKNKKGYENKNIKKSKRALKSKLG